MGFEFHHEIALLLIIKPQFYRNGTGGEDRGSGIADDIRQSRTIPISDGGCNF